MTFEVVTGVLRELGLTRFRSFLNVLVPIEIPPPLLYVPGTISDTYNMCFVWI